VEIIRNLPSTGWFFKNKTPATPKTIRLNGGNKKALTKFFKNQIIALS
jgi:hypothetical protein